MDKKIKNKIAQVEMYKIIVVVAILIMSLGIVWGLSNPPNNYEVYNSEINTASIYDSNDILLSEFKLITPSNYLVPRGYQKVAEFEITNSQDTSLLYDQMKFYNVKDSMKELNRTFDFKFLENVSTEVNDYGDVNVSLEKYKTITNVFDYLYNSTNGTQRNLERYWGDSGFMCEKDTSTNELFGCDYITDDKSVWEIQKGIVGSHFEDILTWKLFDKLKNKENILAGTYTVGIFTDVQEGDKVDWVPTFLGVEIPEWATWTESINAGLEYYYNMDSTGDVIIDSINDGRGNGSTTTIIRGSAGTSGNGFTFAGDDEGLINITEFGSMLDEFTISIWINNSMTTYSMVFGSYSAPEYIRLYMNAGANAVDDAGKIFFTWRDKDGKSIQGSTTVDTPISDGTWHNLIITGNSSANSLLFYVDNVSYATTYDVQNTPVNFGDLTYQIRLGYRNYLGGDIYYTGQMDELAVFSRIVTADERAILATFGNTYTDEFGTCTYSGSGDWNVNCADNCSITENVDLGNNNLSLDGIGTFDINANISNYDKIIKYNGCQINIFSGGIS